MANRVEHLWHWEILKWIAKHLLERKPEGKIIDQNLINCLKNNKDAVIQALRPVMMAQQHLQVACNQFNYAKSATEIDRSIYFMQESEEELQGALEQAKARLINLI